MTRFVTKRDHATPTAAQHAHNLPLDENHLMWYKLPLCYYAAWQSRPTPIDLLQSTDLVRKCMDPYACLSKLTVVNTSNAKTAFNRTFELAA